MASAKCGDLILDAIDQLRKRKARPDFNRISHMLDRRHGLKPRIVHDELELLVEKGIVVRVEYKGNTSYRNAAKWIRTKSQSVFISTSNIGNVQKASEPINSMSVDKSLTDKTHIQDVENVIVKDDALRSINVATRKPEKESTLANVQHQPSGDIAMKKRHEKHIVTHSDWIDIESLDLDDLSNGSDFMKVVKKKKKVLNPKTVLGVPTSLTVEASFKKKGTAPIKKVALETQPLMQESKILTVEKKDVAESKSFLRENVISTKENAAPDEHHSFSTDSSISHADITPQCDSTSVFEYDSSMQDSIVSEEEQTLHSENYCDYCLLDSAFNRKGMPETLLVCTECGAKAHPSCMDSNTFVPDSKIQQWRCPDCRACCMCSSTTNEIKILVCAVCEKSYHMNCHIPPLTYIPTVFCCFFCCSKVKAHVSSLQRSELTEHEIENVKKKNLLFMFYKHLETYPDVVPIADDWSIEEVGRFIEWIGYHKEACAFREQEIDGQSLLLMKRSDVLTGLSIKLGPALKIYTHIRKLQCVDVSQAHRCSEFFVAVMSKGTLQNVAYVAITKYSRYVLQY